jgi:hypothetical protein
VLEGPSQSVAVFTPEGDKVATAKLTEAPVACVAAGKSLHVLTRTSLVTVSLKEALP